MPDPTWLVGRFAPSEPRCPGARALSPVTNRVRLVAMREPDPSTANRRLWHRLQMIEALESHLGGRYWALAAPGSGLDDDDTQTRPLQTSHIVGHCLGFSLDCLTTTRLVLKNPNVDAGLRLPLAGHYPALRAAIESGAQAIWVMSPEDSHERVSRTLRARWHDVVQDDQAMLALTGSTSDDTKEDTAAKNKMRKKNSDNVRAKKKRLRSVAAAAGVAEAEMLMGLPGYGPIVLEAAEITGVASNHQYGMWRLISGLTHPSASRSLSMSVVEELAESDDGIVMAEFTASPSLTNAAIDASLMLHWAALDLAAKRGGRPEVAFTPPPGLPLPPGYEHLEHLRSV